jgi:hypothetical protein
MRKPIVSAFVLAAILSAQPAAAALTDSEKAQIQSFVQKAAIGNAGRVRALVARPDNLGDEGAAPLAAGYGAVPFDEAREKFTREILMGPGSTASRSDIAPMVVGALLGRADAAMRAMPASDTDPKATAVAAELVRIHRFVTEAIANAGHPPADGHDVAAGFRDDSLKALVDLYRGHFERHADELKSGKRVGAALVPVRAQASLAVIDLARGIVQRHEVADLLGLSGSRRALFERHGTLVEDGGTASEERLARALQLLESAPKALDGLQLCVISKAPVGGVTGRGRKAQALVTLGSAPAAGSELGLWPEDVSPSRPDRELGEVAYTTAWIATRAAFAAQPKLRDLATRVVASAQRMGPSAFLSADLPASVLRPEGADATGFQGISPEQLVAHALRLVLLDAPRALDLALYRQSEGRDEPLAAFALALSVLSAESATPAELAVGKTGADGNVDALALKDVTRDGGVVSKLSIDGKTLELALSAAGRVEKATLDGKAPKLSQLVSVRLVPKDKGPWTVGKLHFEVLGGAPLGLVVDDGRFLLRAPPKSDGFEAVVTGDASQDQLVHATLKPSGRGGGLLVRGQPGTTSYDGIGVLVAGDAKPVATLILVDGKGKATELSKPVSLDPAPDGHAVSLQVKDLEVHAIVGGKKLDAQLSRAAGTGRRGLFVVADGGLEVSDYADGPLKPAKKTKMKAAAGGAKKKAK